MRTLTSLHSVEFCESLTYEAALQSLTLDTTAHSVICLLLPGEHKDFCRLSRNCFFCSRREERLGWWLALPKIAVIRA